MIPKTTEGFIEEFERALGRLTSVVDTLQSAKGVMRQMLYDARTGVSPELIIKSLSYKENDLLQTAQETVKAV